MPAQPLISVVICTYNRDTYIVDALNSLDKQSLSPSDFQIVIVNNNSTDNTESLCKNFIATHPHLSIIYVNESNQGLSFARNRGLVESTAEIISYLDDDAIAEPNFLAEIIDFMSIHPESAAVGGKIIPRYISSEPSWMSKYVYALVGGIDLGNELKEYSGERYPRGSNMSIRKNVLEHANGFDTGLGRIAGKSLASEEKDLFERLKNKGYRFHYLPQLVVHHVVDDHRLTKAAIRKLANGFGVGERIRMKKKNIISFWIKLIEIQFKYFAALILGIGFMLSMRRAKAEFIVMVQWQILWGYLKGV